MEETAAPSETNSVLTAESPESLTREVRAGRVVSIETRADSDELTIRAPDGRLEISIVFTDKGASVSMEAADLRIGTPGDLSVKCRRFELEAEEAAQIYSDDKLVLLSRETILRSADYITMNAGAIRRQGP